jgi:hypothetical protein
MDLTNKYIASIMRAKDEESLAIFIGAGVSKSSETKTVKMPSWSDLIDSFIADLNIEGETDYLKLAQLYYLSFGEHLYYKKIKEFFPDNIPHSPVHDLIFKLNPHAVITTNWDCLLESAINDKSYFYNVVASDEDLMKSYLGKKLIKMHGDFKNHNIVFKEDDYINYKFNFPLIENFVKSILSTNTILFIGYSYNDIDLKQIIKWTQNHSSIRPPMYLAVFKDIPSQRKYLESHGITTIVLNDEGTKRIDKNEYTNKLFNFLNKLNGSEFHSDLNDNEIVEIVYSKIKSLQSLNFILADQITRCFTNCGLVYIDDNGPKALLRFYDKEITSNDNNFDLRNLYKKFISILNDENKIKKINSKLQNIFMLLRKADIYGVILDSKQSQAILTSEILTNRVPITIDKEIDFNYEEIGNAKAPKKQNEKVLAYNNFQLHKFDESYKLIEGGLSSEIKQRDYANLFISLFNQNVVLNRLKYDFKNKNDIYSHLVENKIHELYDSLPKNIRNSVSVIYDLVTFGYLFNLHYTSTSILTKYTDKKDFRQTLIIDSDNHKADFILRNVILFILKNGCLIDVYKEFKDIVRNFIEAKFIKNHPKNEICLDRLDLYVCIKYFDNKILTHLLMRKNQSQYELNLAQKDLDWLVNVAMLNLKSNYIQYQGAFNPIENDFINSLRVASVANLSVEHDEAVLKIINESLIESYHNIAFYDSLSEYIVVRYNRGESHISKFGLQNVIDSILNKIASDNLGGYERIAIVNRGLPDLFSIAKNMKIEFNDSVKAKKILAQISEYSDSDRARASATLVFDLYNISSGQVSEILKEFILNTPISKFNEEKKVRFELFLLASEITDEYNDLPKRVEKIIPRFKAYSFNTEAESMLRILTYLVEKRGLNEFKQVMEELKKIVDKYKDI